MHIDGVTVRHDDPRQLSDEDLVKVNAFGNVLRAESKPEEPPTPLEVTTQGVRNIPSFVEVHGWRAERDADATGEIVAAAEAMIPHTGENEHMLQAGVKVHPDHRRQGLGWRLLHEVVGLAEEKGKRLILSSTTGKVPAGQAFAERLGAKPGLVHRTSELPLADVDRALVERWLAEAPGRAPGYELVLFEGAYPESEYAQLIGCLEVMNTAPREDLDVEDQHMTPEQFAEIERAMAAQGVERWAAFVRHTDTGEYVAFSDLYWHPSNPAIINQGGTGVAPEHRGHALGKWVKAVLLLKALDERPEAKLIRTSNAYTNDAMLGINNQLGFVEKFSETIWQLEVAQARKVLAERASV